VLRLAEFEEGGVVAADPLDGVKRAGASDLDLSHGGEIEQASSGPYGQMFLGMPGVLEGHRPAGKGRQAGPQSQMLPVQRRQFGLD
jgi:hypothetical protein